MEHGGKPHLVDNDGTLILPEIRTNNQEIDIIIRKAWLGHYSQTSEMLDRLISTDTNDAGGTSQGIHMHSESTGLLRVRVKKWKEYRENKFDKKYVSYK